MNFIKRLIPVLLIITMVVSISGCNLVQVDPEKDAQRVVIKTKDDKILKKDFNNYLAYYEMMYILNNYTLPTEEEDLKTFKEGLLDNMVEVYLLKQEAIKEKLDVDTSTVETDADNYIQSYIKGFETEDKYTGFLKERNMTEDDFKAFLKTFLEDVAYANAYSQHFVENTTNNSGEELSKVVATVDGEKINKDQFYYKLMEMEFFYYTYYQQGLPTDEEELASIYTQIIDDMVKSYLVSKDAQAQDIKLNDDDVKAKIEEIKSQYSSSLPDEDSLNEFLKGYYLTVDKYNELIEMDAKNQLYDQAIKENYEKNVKVTDEQIQKYYDENKDSYSTVSAKHILTKDEDLAKEISSKVTDAASFDKAWEKYKDNENVTEEDLGAFNKGQMEQAFEDAAFGLEKGAVSKEPVHTSFGYHTIYVYDKSNPTLEEKKDEIKKTLISNEVSTKYSVYTDGLVNNAKITKEEIKEPYEILIEKLKKDYNIKTYPKRIY